MFWISGVSWISNTFTADALRKMKTEKIVDKCNFTKENYHTTLDTTLNRQSGSNSIIKIESQKFILYSKNDPVSYRTAPSCIAQLVCRSQLRIKVWMYRWTARAVSKWWTAFRFFCHSIKRNLSLPKYIKSVWTLSMCATFRWFHLCLSDTCTEN